MLAQSAEGLERIVSAQRSPGAADHAECLSGGVGALEACAAVWQELAPVAGQRQVHLLRRLEQRLEREEADVLSGQANYALRPISVRIALTRAVEAIEQLKHAGEERVQTLEALEDASVWLAAIAVRAALNIRQAGAASGDGPPLPGRATVDLDAIADEIAGAAGAIAAAERARGEEANVGSWLSQALVLRLPPVATPHERGDPTLRAEALLGLRIRWLRLGALELLMLEALDGEIAAAGGTGEALAEELPEGAARLLRRARLASRPGAFDFRRAWERQLAALGHVVDPYCRGLAGDRSGLRRARRSVLASLVRVAAALWMIDARLGDHRGRRASTERLAGDPATCARAYDAVLAEKVSQGGAQAVGAALELLELCEPATFSEAVKLVCGDGACADAAFDAIADAWERYHIVRHLPWD
jgi:hypothetical protein